MSKETGGAAFPDPGRAQSAKQRTHLTETGMTLRDYFAAKAMASVVSGAMTDGSFAKTAPSEFATAAYMLADAMIAARGAA